MTEASPETPLLSVENLRVSLGQPRIEAVKGIGFTLQRGEIVGLAGESGSGKSVSSMALTRLLPRMARPTCTGSVRLSGEQEDLLAMKGSALRRIRGRRIAYVFQEPSSSFNPVIRIASHLNEVLAIAGIPSGKRKERMEATLEEVGIAPSGENLRAYPPAFSGGMQQRLAIACALAARPDLLVADEPTTALDTSTQKRIVDLLVRLNREHGMAILFISHNLGLLKQFAARLIIMRHGEIVEEGATSRILESPQHPYTRALIEAVPKFKKYRG